MNKTILISVLFLAFIGCDEPPITLSNINVVLSVFGTATLLLASAYALFALSVLIGKCCKSRPVPVPHDLDKITIMSKCPKCRKILASFKRPRLYWVNETETKLQICDDCKKVNPK